MMETFLAYAGAVLIVSGSVFGLLAAIGILRLPDLFTRMHAASKAGAVGGGLILLAMAVVAWDGPIFLRAILGVLFLLLTTPVSAHLLARAALRSGQTPTRISNTDGTGN
jgi:multicomponent Na+:H+ antiporter subunit G